MSVRYRPEIDGLRAIAVSVVVLYHAFPSILPGGFVGVDVFFAISGYLITSIIINDVRSGSYSLKSFYIRRIRRVFPALAIVLTATLCIGWFVLLPGEFTQLGEHAVAAVFFASNLMLWHQSGYFDTEAIHKPLLHLWSLGIEEQFYIVWPLIVAAFARSRLTLAVAMGAICVASFLHADSLIASDPTAAFYSPTSRAWELAIGGLVALAFSPDGNVKLPWPICDAIVMAGLYALTASILTMNHTLPFPGSGAVLPVIGAVAILAAGRRSKFATHVLGNGFLVYVGLISYPLYLWHWPLISFANTMLLEAPDAGVMIWVVVASISLATATYLFIERNVKLLPSWRKATPYVACSAMGLIGLFALSVYASDGMLIRYPTEIQKVLAISNYKIPSEARYPECWLRADVPVESISKACGFSNNGKIKVLIWGDSHAAMLYSGFEHQVGGAFDLAQFTRSSCPPLIGFPGFCGEANRKMLEIIRDSNPDILILSGAWANYGDFKYHFNQSDDLRRTLDAAKQTGAKRIVVLGPAPFWTPYLPMIVYREWSLSRTIPDRVAYGFTDLVKDWDRDVRKAALKAGVDYFSVADYFCTADGCRTQTGISDGDLIAFDSSHLTMSATGVIVDMLMEKGMLKPKG